MGWQWHQLDHMQIIFTLLQTDNHALPAPYHSIFYRPDTLPATNNVKALKAIILLLLLKIRVWKVRNTYHRQPWHYCLVQDAHQVLHH